MASTIKLKNSTTSGNAPSSLETGEVAINVADGNLFYGSASAVKQHFIVDELEVKGNLTAQQYIVSSSVTYTTQSFSSGSTAFGDSADDTHVFTGNVTASNNISSSGDIIGQNFTAHDVLSTSFTGSVDNPAIRLGPLAGNLAGNKVGLMMEDLSPPNKLFVPYFVANGAKIFGFGTLMDMQAAIQMNSNKLTFDGDSTNTYIVSDAETPENLEVHADGNIELRADDDLQVYSDVDITGEITASGNISSSGTITANSLVGSHTLTTAAQPNVTSLGTLTALTVDNLNLNSNTLSSTSDTDVFMNLGTAGFGFEANTGDKFIFNANQNNVDLHYASENDANVFYIDASADKVGIGDATPTAKLDVAGDINTTSHITASGNISASGTIIAATLDAAAVSDTLAAAIVAEIDNDEIPVAKLAEDSISGVTLGGNLNNLTVDNATLQLDSGTTYNGSAAKTISIKDGGVDSDALAADITVTGDLTVGGSIIHNGDTDTKIAFTTNAVKITAGNLSNLESSVTGSTLPNVHQNIYNTSSLALNANSAFGDIVKFGGSTTVAGGLYFLNTSGGWTLAQANSISTGASASLAVAVGTNSTTDGMCIRGFVNPFEDPTDAPIGGQVFMSDNANGRITGSAPSDTNDIVRVVGYRYGTDLVYFNPSNDFIVHA